MKKRLAIIQTGGTIASRPDALGRVQPSDVGPSLASVSRLSAFEVSIYQPFNLPGPHIAVSHMEMLRHLIERIAPDVDGIVITHGTDTLEETAFYLYLTLDVNIPVVLTGSMRHAEEPSWDGPGNVWGSALTAMDPRSQGRAVLVVFGGDIFDARTVTKVHTSLLHAFGGYPGPIGQVGVGLNQEEVHYFAQPPLRSALPTPVFIPRVDILYAYAGWQGEGLSESLSNAQGLVIAALGTGNLPPAVAVQLEAARIPVVLATRTHAGPILPIYGYPGGGKLLLDQGLIPASFLNAHKARILLLVLLGAGFSHEAIAEVFARGV